MVTSNIYFFSYDSHEHIINESRKKMFLSQYIQIYVFGEFTNFKTCDVIIGIHTLKVTLSIVSLKSQVVSKLNLVRYQCNLGQTQTFFGGERCLTFPHVFCLEKMFALKMLRFLYLQLSHKLQNMWCHLKHSCTSDTTLSIAFLEAYVLSK